MWNLLSSFLGCLIKLKEFSLLLGAQECRLHGTHCWFDTFYDDSLWFTSLVKQHIRSSDGWSISFPIALLPKESLLRIKRRKAIRGNYWGYGFKKSKKISEWESLRNEFIKPCYKGKQRDRLISWKWQFYFHTY